MFQKNTRQNRAFEQYLLDSNEPLLLDATRHKAIPLTYFTSAASPATTSPSPPGSPATTSSPPRTSSRQSGKADAMPEESYRIINVQKPGGHAHSLVIIKSKAITTNAANIGIFESNGQYTQREIDIVDRTTPQDESDVTKQYLSPISPKLCINYGNNKHNPGYCGIFGIICIIAFRHYNTAAPQWLQKWKQLLDYMRQDIPDESAVHGCLGVALAAKVQEIIASATPASPAAFQQAEKEIIKEIKKCVKSIANYRNQQEQ